MLRKRMFIVLGGCFFAASATWADGVAYVDCNSHPEVTQVFGKPRRTPETVAGIPCGERFTILQYGFIFSRIQTKDGQVGYVYSNLISSDRSGAALPPPTEPRSTAAPSSVPAATPTVAPPNSTAPTPPQAASIQQVPAATPATANPPNTTAPVVQPSSTSVAQSQATAARPGAASPTQTQAPTVQPAPAQVPTAPSSAPGAPATSASPSSVAPEQVHAAPTQPAAVEAAASAGSVSGTSATSATPAPETASASQPEAASAAQPESAPGELAPPIRSVRARESWERPNAGGIRRMPLIELFGGYGFTRFDNGSGAAATNFNGVLGSFGWNVKPWLQIVADSSYNVVTVSGVKNVLYGNHWGPRVFWRGRNRWGLMPFVEGLVGGSRADATVSGAGGYTTSQNVISYKVGGGVDIKPSRRFEIRLLDVDYYRTSFGTNLRQNNYSASAGIVLRLFVGAE
jgi:hypothetical protein